MENQAKAYGLPIKYFGYDFFRKPPSSFLPVTDIPVGPDYLIGPEDTIRIILWGNVQGEYRQTVNRNGQIAIPQVGVVHVSGLTFKQLQQVLEREFSVQYKNFQINVTLDTLRTIQVFVVGQARSPGSYSISSLSTLVNALFAAGGPSKNGSMRDIQVRRRGRVIVHFDLYDFLIKGDKSKDIRLMPEDVIFIPVAGDRAGIGGPMKVPAIYELKRERTLTGILQMAGGLAASAFKSRVQILRFKDRKEIILVEDDLEKFTTGKRPDIPLVDGDLIKIFPVPSQDIKLVRVSGAVQNPGEFGLHEGMRIKDLLVFAGGILSYTSLEEAEVTRVKITPQGPETTRILINLRRALAGYPRDNIVLKPNDYLFIRTVPEWDLYKTVTIAGEVKFPGTYAIKKGETLSSLLARAGGFSSKAYPNGVFFTRQAVKATQQEQLKKAIQRIELDVLSLATEKTQTELEEKEAERQKIFVKQQKELLTKLREVVPLGRVVIRLDDPERLQGTPDDIDLQEGDSLLVPQIQQTINVLGAVVNPTAIVYKPYFTVNDYIAGAGGVSRTADPKETYVVKANGAAMTRRESRWFTKTTFNGVQTYHFGGFTSMRLEPGDTIIVPEQLERIAWLREIKDIATILGQIAVVAGVVLVGLK